MGTVEEAAEKEAEKKDIEGEQKKRYIGGALRRAHMLKLGKRVYGRKRELTKEEKAHPVKGFWHGIFSPEKRAVLEREQTHRKEAEEKEKQAEEAARQKKEKAEAQRQRERDKSYTPQNPEVHKYMEFKRKQEKREDQLAKQRIRAHEKKEAARREEGYQRRVAEYEKKVADKEREIHSYELSIEDAKTRVDTLYGGWRTIHDMEGKVYHLNVQLQELKREGPPERPKGL